MTAGTADDVLDAIDSALHDWSVSEDAMRWQPEEMRAPELEPAGEGLALGYVDFAAVFTGCAFARLPEWTPPFGEFSHGTWYIPAGTYRLDGPLPYGITLMGAGRSETTLMLDEAPEAVLPPAPVPGWTVEHWPPVASTWPPPAAERVRLTDPGQRAAWRRETSPGAVLPVPESGIPGILAAAGLADDGHADLWPQRTKARRRRR